MLTLLNVLSAASILFLVALGLEVILGIMGVINMAHPGLMAVGAYASLEVTRHGAGIWVAMLIAAAAVGLLGALIEPLLRRLYHRPLDTILATWGLSLAITQLIVLAFGQAPVPFEGPGDGLTSVAGTEFSSYRLTLIGLAVAFGLVLQAVVSYTRMGLLARAVMADENLARGLGINTSRVRMVTFALGAGLAGLSGALIAPLAPLEPYMGVGYLIPAFLIVLLAGRSVAGLALAVAVLSTTQTVVALHTSSVVAGIVLVVVAMLLLRLRPQGLLQGSAT
ncbi:branched-chain amino acid ABC transporter permease [Actinomadura sp. B10D3]|uniref:branched-chain amino acid ABC transporter permease n=1 Tax=Actinomadura sp. B10D3 TaxID=3153557 RepID=UPI00325CB6CF